MVSERAGLQGGSLKFVARDKNEILRMNVPHSRCWRHRDTFYSHFNGTALSGPLNGETNAYEQQVSHEQQPDSLHVLR
jgi:hypothetical protein